MSTDEYTRRRFIGTTVASALAATGLPSVFAAAADSKSSPKRSSRFAVAGIFEEVNTFAVESMGYAAITGDMSTGFQKFEGKQIVDEYKGTATQIGGYIAALHDAGAELVPTIYYSYSAGPTIEGKAYGQMKGEILAALKAAMPLDGVLLAIHGAGVSQGVDDIEGDLCAAVRKELGPEVKIGANLDLHATMTSRSIEEFDFITIVKHYPHIDFYDGGYHAAKALLEISQGKLKAFSHFEQIPFILQTISTMPGSLYAPIRLKAEEFARRKGIHEFSVQYGFPWSDIPFNTAATNCWAETPELATETAREFAEWLWQNRAGFVAKTLSARDALAAAADQLVAQRRLTEEAVRDAKARNPSSLYDASISGLTDTQPGDPRTYGFLPDKGRKGPVVIADKADNPGAGAPGDSTHILAELIKHEVKQACVSTIRDPEVVKLAVEAGVGNVIDVELGGKLTKLGGKPIKGKAYVKSISDGRFQVIGPMLHGMRFDVGPAVGLQIAGIDVAVVSGFMQSFDNGQMKIMGFDPNDYRIVVLKSAVHFRAYWTDVASAIVDADPPGIATNNLSDFKYTRKRAKVYPLDLDAKYPEVT